jgi:hypothetical protein
MGDTSIWVPILSAFAALLGVGFGAMLQGRYGAASWQRQIRLEAYTGLLNAAHNFDSLLFDTLNAIEESGFGEGRRKLEESYSRLQSAGSLVEIAGPKGVDNALTSILRNASGVVKDARDPDVFMQVAYDWRKSRSYDRWSAWIEAVEQFTPTVRRILKTEQ